MMPNGAARYAALLSLALSGSVLHWPAEPLRSRQTETGRIAGTVELSTVLATRRPRFRIYADAGPGSVPPTQPPADIASEQQNVVIYLDANRGLAPSATDVAAARDSARRNEMAQSDERFTPHVLPVVAGAQVDFPNRDDIYHNVFSLSRTRTFDLGRYPRGS